MPEQDFQKRQDSPVLDYNQPRQNFKLSKRKENIHEILWNKRNPLETIKEYNFQIYKRTRHHKMKRYGCCRSTSHLKIYIPVHKEKMFHLLVQDLKQRISQ